MWSSYHTVLAVKACARAAPVLASALCAAWTAALRCEASTMQANPPAIFQKRISIMNHASTNKTDGTNHSHPLDNTAQPIVATAVPESQRLEFLPRHFGKRMLQVENYIYRRFSTLCKDYRGGYWEFVNLSNGGCYFVPSGQQFHIEQTNNCFDGTVSGDAAGIIVTLYAMSELAFQYEDEEIFATRFHQLRDFAGTHAESALIFKAID